MKHKRIILIALATLFIISLFIIKNSSQYKNEPLESYGGLTYAENATIVDLVNSDSDGDGVFDWEEGLWGTDPLKRDTDDDGIMDATEVENLKSAQALKNENSGLDFSGSQTVIEEENLTETDKFSREFFSTVAVLNQAGEVDQATVDKLSTSLMEEIENSVQRKIFTPADIKISGSDSKQDTQNYFSAFTKIQAKYPINNSVIDILQKFIIDENNVDLTALDELDPIIEKLNKTVNEMAKLSVPQSIANRHLNFLNAFKILIENTEDIKLFESDIVIALKAMSQYESNTLNLESAIGELMNAIRNKLNS